MKVSLIRFIVVAVLLGVCSMVVALFALISAPHNIHAQTSVADFTSQLSPYPQTTVTICPGTGTLEGVDVSEFKGVINWSLVSQAGKSFAYARAADGATITDTRFLAYYAGIKSAGMKAGGYLFFEPDQDPVQQANLFIRRLTLAGFMLGDLAPVFDVEVTGGQISTTVAAHLQTALNTVHNALHVTPVIYTNLPFWNASVGSTAFGANPLWTAQYTPACPSMPTGWSNWSLWQYTDTVSVSGINSPVSLDRSNGSTLPRGGFAAYLPITLNNAP